MSEENLNTISCTAAMEIARKHRLNEALITLAEWVAKRERGEFNTDTTLTMLAKKVVEIEHSVRNAGCRAYAAAYDKQQNQNRIGSLRAIRLSPSVKPLIRKESRADL